MKNIIELTNFSYFEPIKGLKAKIVHTKNQTYAFWEIKQGTVLPVHKHIHEQVSIITKGELELSINGKTTLIKKGMVAL